MIDKDVSSPGSALKKISIVVPAYNEAKFIGHLLEQLVGLTLDQYKFEKEIIVVNDGSVDATAEIASRFDGVLLINQDNQGKGAAVQRGVREASGQWVLVQDADLEYDPREIPSMLAAIPGREKVAVYGSRTLGVIKKHGKKWPTPGRAAGQDIGPWLMNRLLTLLGVVLFGQAISDLLTGYKVYPVEFLRSIDIKTQGFETDHELTAKLIRNGFKIVEVPISYVPRSVAEGKKIRLRDGITAIGTLIRFRFFN